MTKRTDNRTIDRFTVAANDLTCRSLDPAFANDGSSLAFIAGVPLDQAKSSLLAETVATTGVDVIHLAFAAGDEAAGPVAVTVLAERWGVVHRWSDCVLWAPPGLGPLIIAQRAGRACFAHDGRALFNVDKPKSLTSRAGEERARRRLRAAAVKISDARLAWANGLKQKAA